MKKIICLMIVAVLVLVSCSEKTPEKATEKQESKEIVLTVNNYSDYFYSEAYSEIEVKESALGSVYFVNKVHITFDLKQNADIKNIVINGNVDLPLDSSHLLHKEKKLPVSFSVNINVNGHGETDVYFQHGTGAYGGYGARDYIIYVEDITGSLVLSH